jgi:hypothetical protein
MPVAPLSSAPSANATMGEARMKHKPKREHSGKRARRGSIALLERLQPDAAGIDCG